MITSFEGAKEVLSCSEKEGLISFEEITMLGKNELEGQKKRNSHKIFKNEIRGKGLNLDPRFKRK